MAEGPGVYLPLPLPSFLTGAEIGAQIGDIAHLLRAAKSINASKVGDTLIHPSIQSVSQERESMPGTTHAEVKLMACGPPGRRNWCPEGGCPERIATPAGSRRESGKAP